MELYNADGSRAEMSGNGIRCLAQALALGWPGLGAGDDVAIATDAGLRSSGARPARRRDPHAVRVDGPA